ncbi:MAG: hypothetical protein HC848_10780, partial [Limnobacter sp.]|nr:hypothetical protein [Limnobacter sp.]
MVPALPPKLSGFQVEPRLLQCCPHAQVYAVGGTVRDELLGAPQADRDWVVVGATPQAMLDAGFTPVGADFPVFLHPKTHEEYALARTERKSGIGYKGFTFYAAPEVTLEQDLVRRDFTLNAMAMAADGTVFDPFNGYADLQAGVFRHIGPAFAEDPLRVLRLGRFLARFHTFTVHADTLALCQKLVNSGEMTTLVPERVFAELNKGMAQARPARMWQLLAGLHALKPLFQGRADSLSASHHALVQTLVQLPAEAWQQLNALPGAWARWVGLLGMHGTPEGVQALARHLRIPNEIRDGAVVFARLGALLATLQAQNPVKGPLETSRPHNEGAAVGPLPSLVLAWLEQVDVFRKPQRLHSVLGVHALLPTAAQAPLVQRMLVVLGQLVHSV